MRIKRPSHATVVAYVALSMGLGGTAVAATGGSFILGSNNFENRQAMLHNTAGGPALRLSTSDNATPPFTVSNGTRVPGLNADRLDNLTASQLQRRVSGFCPAGSAVRVVAVNGSVSCAAIPAATSARSAHRSSGPSGAPSGPSFTTIVTQEVPRGFYVINAKAVLITSESTGSDCILTYQLPGGSEVEADRSNQPLTNHSVTARSTHNLQRLLQFGGRGGAVLRLKCRAGVTWSASDSQIISNKVQHAVDTEVNG
jgi:hypothetical protein